MNKVFRCLLCLAALNITVASAASNSVDQKSLSQQAQQIRSDINALSEQLKDLQKHQAALEAQQNKAKQKVDEVKLEHPEGLKWKTRAKKVLQLGRTEGPEPDELFTPLPYGYRILANLGGTAVLTSPYIHSRYEFTGSGLIANYSSINRDVAALRQRQNFEKSMNDSGLKMPSYPLVELSGVVEGQIFHVNRFNGGTNSDINLSSAELDVQALINPWFTGFISFNYDDTPPFIGHRVTNSNVYVNNAFITFGNLNRNPLYATLGQVYVPFGSYSSYMVSAPLIRSMFRVRARALSVGFQEQDGDGLYGSLFTFRGDSRNGTNKSSHINQIGGNLGVRFDIKKLRANLGGSFINNVADAEGMQLTSYGAPRFQGFASSEGNQDLTHRVSGADLRATFDLGPFTWISEYTTALRSFDPVDMSFNYHGAKPAGFHTEGVYHFGLYERPMSITVGYDKTQEALAIGIPKERIGLSVGAVFWQNTLLSLQVTHAHNYSAKDVASGSNGIVFGPVGHSETAGVLQFDVYF